MEFDSNEADCVAPQARGRRTLYAANHQGNADYDEEEDESEEGSDFMQGIEKVVYYEDLDQKYKGANINYIGKIKG